MLTKWILSHDVLQVFTGWCCGQDDPASAGNLPAGSEKHVELIILLEKTNVGSHMLIQFLQGRNILKVDDKHSIEVIRKIRIQEIGL